MAWGILSKLVNGIKPFHPTVSKVSLANIAQARKDISNAPKWSNKPSVSFRGANQFLGPAGPASRPGGYLSGAIGRPSGYRRSHMSDEEF
jgi:hypothetical protein